MLQFPTKLTIDARNPDSELRARILATKPRATKGIFLCARRDPSPPAHRRPRLPTPVGVAAMIAYTAARPPDRWS
jgi:hypothetical protein